MFGRYEAYVDNIALSSLDPAILVLNIEPVAQSVTTNTAKAAYRSGAMITNRRADSVGAVITFEIHEYDIVKRQTICQMVSKWADGSILKTNDRPGQQLRCVCNQYPVAKARDWTEAVTVGFDAYCLPFWVDETPTTLTLTGTSQSSNLYVPGNGDPALVEVDVKANASVSSVTLGVGSTSIQLTGLSMASNSHIYITYDDKQIQSIKHGTTSIMSKRTAGSNDDLLAECGKISTFSVTASASVSATFKVRGCWR